METIKKNNNIKFCFSIIGMIFGLCLIIFGVMSLKGHLSESFHNGHFSSYDSGFASFGGDYYTYSVNNAAEAASAARAASSNVCLLIKFLQKVLGLSLIGIGGIAISAFGIVLAGRLPLQIKNEENEIQIVTESSTLDYEQNEKENNKKSELSGEVKNEEVDPI